MHAATVTNVNGLSKRSRFIDGYWLVGGGVEACGVNLPKLIVAFLKNVLQKIRNTNLRKTNRPLPLKEFLR